MTTIATALLVAALAIAPIWDTAIYLRAVQDTLNGDAMPDLPSHHDRARAFAEPMQTGY